MYFCKNCGEPFSTDEAIMCVKCGVFRDSGNNYCHNCGNPVAHEAKVCMNCGVATNNYYVSYDTNGYGMNTASKSRIAAGLFGIFLGSFGIHNFYLGYTSKAVIQLVLTIVGYLLYCLGIGILITLATYIWGLVEGIMILSGKIDADSRGLRLKE